MSGCWRRFAHSQVVPVFIAPIQRKFGYTINNTPNQFESSGSILHGISSRMLKNPYAALKFGLKMLIYGMQTALSRPILPCPALT